MPVRELDNVKESLILRVAPDKRLDKWRVFREGEKEPRDKGLTKKEAVKVAFKMAEKKEGPATVFVHKTRYIVERCLRIPA